MEVGFYGVGYAGMQPQKKTDDIKIKLRRVCRVNGEVYGVLKTAVRMNEIERSKRSGMSVETKRSEVRRERNGVSGSEVE